MIRIKCVVLWFEHCGCDPIKVIQIKSIFIVKIQAINYGIFLCTACKPVSFRLTQMHLHMLLSNVCEPKKKKQRKGFVRLNFWYQTTIEKNYNSDSNVFQSLIVFIVNIFSQWRFFEYDRILNFVLKQIWSKKKWSRIIL